MTIEASVLSRLIAARHLIATSGQDLTFKSDPLSVAQKILAAHDAAELTFLALKAELGLEVPERDGRQKSEPSFWALADAVLKKAYGSNSSSLSSKSELMEQLNKARVAFKHYGRLPDTASSYHLFSDTSVLLDNICKQLIGSSLSEIDEAIAINQAEVSERLARARSLIESGEYKAAFEQIAFGLATAFWNLSAPSSWNPGKPSSEAALLLSGRGIDPASFLTMQQLLPVAYPLGGDAVWDLRGTGHEGNWTRENSEFCRRVAIATIIRLQIAPTLPKPMEFYERFEDVVEIVVENPTVYLERGHLFSSKRRELFTELLKGDRITGKAIGHSQDQYNLHDASVDLEYAQYIALEGPKHSALKPEDRTLYTQTLWFQSEEIAITHRLKKEGGGL